MIDKEASLLYNIYFLNGVASIYSTLRAMLVWRSVAVDFKYFRWLDQQFMIEQTPN